MRNLLVAQDHDTIKLLTVGPQIKEKYTLQTLEVSSIFLIKSLNLISQADLNYKSARNQRLLVELCLINIGSLTAAGQSQEGKSPSKTTISASPEIKKKQVEVRTEKPIKESDSDLPKEVEVVKSEDKIEKTDYNKPVIPVKKEEPEEPLIKKQEEVARAEEPKVEFANPQKDDSEDLPKTSSPQKSTSVPDVVEDKTDFTEKNTSDSKRRFHDDLIADHISIKSFTSIQDKESNDDSDGEQIVKYKEAVTQEKLSEGWKKLLHDFDNKGRMMLYATLSKYPPKVIDNDHIEITYDNKAQAEAIRKEKTGILEILRAELKNDLLKLKLTISDQVHQRAYTDSEKLEKMIEKNPNISLLKNKLDLDL